MPAVEKSLDSVVVSIREPPEPLLKGVNPRLFDVATPEQFRRAFAAMLDQIARL